MTTWTRTFGWTAPVIDWCPPNVNRSQVASWIESGRCLACGTERAKFPTRWKNAARSVRCLGCVESSRPMPDAVREHARRIQKLAHMQRKRGTLAEPDHSERNDLPDWRSQRPRRAGRAPAARTFLSSREWAVLGVVPGMAAVGPDPDWHAWRRPVDNRGVLRRGRAVG